jgi:hypothetical protein
MGEAAIDLPDNYFDEPKAEYLSQKSTCETVECNQCGLPNVRCFLCMAKHLSRQW